MGLIDKNFSVPKFDKVIRTQQSETLLSLIFSTHWAWMNGEVNEENRKKNIQLRLKPLYDIFKMDQAGTYGEDESKIADQFSRQYTIGHDMGIWIDKDLHLSKYALEVAEHKMTVREYLTRVFSNLFIYLDGKYTHILYSVCEYLEQNNQVILEIEDISRALELPVDETREQAKIIFNYLASTNLFVEVETTKKTEMKMKVAEGYTIELIKSMCNLQYKDADGETTREQFKNKKAYAEYIAQPYLKVVSDVEKQPEDNKQTEIINERKDPYNIECEQRKNTIQTIIYGPPGTGKSFSITDIIKKSYKNFDLKIDNPFVFRTTLHPEYTYNDFIGQIMPVVKEEKITYDFSPGIFTKALDTAIKHPNNDIYLILEEMSRANVAAVFGDVFQLLDRSNGESDYQINHDIISKYIYNTEDHKISLPSNLHIVGTVNTSDQNVFVMDTAFKRRFNFEYMDLDPVKDDKGDIFLNNYPLQFKKESDGRVIHSDWITFYQEFNEFIVANLGLSEDKQLGQFFIKFSDNGEDNKNAICNKLLQYIWQDIHQVSYSKTSIFRKEIQTFSKAYSELKKALKLNNPIDIFSDELVQQLSKEGI